MASLIRGTCDEWEAIKERKEQEHKEQIKRIQDLVNGFNEVDDAIERHSNIVADAIFNGEPQEDVMKKAMDFTKEIDEMKGKETHWDKEPTFGDKYARAFLSSMNDPVKHPAHYTEGKYECIDYIQCRDYGFELGNAVKYLTRAGKKSPGKEIEDLRKAVQYLDFYYDRINNPEGDWIGIIEYSEDKGFPALLASALSHIDRAHTITYDPEVQKAYVHMAIECISAYIRELGGSDYDKEMVGNRTE